MDFGLRLRNLRQSKDMSQNELAKRLNLASSSVARYESGERKPDTDRLIDIANLFNVTTDYLLCKTDSPYLYVEDLASTVRLSPNSREKAIRVPTLGYIRGGEPMMTDDNFLGYEEMIVPASASADDFIGLKVEGDSMMPLISEGSTVIIKLQPTCEMNDICAVRVNGEAVTVKRVKRLPDGLYLIPENSAYSPKFFTADEVTNLPVEIIGKVIEIRTKI